MTSDSGPARKIRAKVTDNQNLSNLSAEEGFLWSRLGDGLPLHEVVLISPFSAEETAKRLQDLVKKGAAEWIEAPGEPAAPLSEFVARELAADEAHPEWKTLNRAMRIEILQKFESIEAATNPYEILEATPRTSEQEMKRLYLSLSKRFHPDRFFKFSMGPYKQKLDSIFTRIQKAHATLKNSHEREAINRKLNLQNRPKAPPTIPKTLSQEVQKIGKAEHHFKQGLEQEKARDYMAAYNSYVLAVQLNANREQYQKAMNDVRPYMLKEKAKQIIEKAHVKVQLAGSGQDILQMAEDAMRCDPDLTDAQLLWAKQIVELKMVDKVRDAKERLLRAKAKLPKDPEPRYLLARCHLFLGDDDAALREAEEVLKIQPSHGGARRIVDKTKP